MDAYPKLRTACPRGYTTYFDCVEALPSVTPWMRETLLGKDLIQSQGSYCTAPQ
jgi:hypothetical protein